MGKSWERDIDLTFRGWTAAAGIVAAGLLAWVVLLGTRVREEPSRCPAGFVQNDARCCAPGADRRVLVCLVIARRTELENC